MVRWLYDYPDHEITVLYQYNIIVRERWKRGKSSAKAYGQEKNYLVIGKLSLVCHTIEQSQGKTSYNIDQECFNWKWELFSGLVYSNKKDIADVAFKANSIAGAQVGFIF